MDEGKFCGMVMLDLQKAFDTVDYAILIMKLKVMGFSGSTLKWVNSYLTNRTQLVDINGTLSESGSIECGVPQGSIFGPLFFLLYINDLIAAASCSLFLYADDVVLMVAHKNKSVVENTLSEEL